MHPRAANLIDEAAKMNLSGRLTLGSRTYGWEVEGVGLGADGVCGSTGRGLLDVPF